MRKFLSHVNAHLGHKIAVLYNQMGKMSHHGYSTLFPWLTCNLFNELMNKVAIVTKWRLCRSSSAWTLLTKINPVTTTAKYPAHQQEKPTLNPGTHHSLEGTAAVRWQIDFIKYLQSWKKQWLVLTGIDTLILDTDLPSLYAKLLPSPPSVNLLNVYSLSLNPTQHCSDKGTHFTAKRVRQWAKAQRIH